MIVNADDFGRSPAINQAVRRAHRDGILTTASLMVTGVAAMEAVAMARDHPRLGVGLHLTLLDGQAALPPAALAGLVNARGTFPSHPVRTGWRYFWDRSLRPLLRDEIAAQLDRFRATGLALDHLNGHFHMHLHPVVFSLLVQEAAHWGLTHLRLTRDPFWRNARLASGRWGYRAFQAAIFAWLARRARPALRRSGIKHTAAVYGLLQHGRVDERYLARLLDILPPGDFELYCHPSLDPPCSELEALISPRIKSQITERGIRLIRYQDL